MKCVFCAVCAADWEEIQNKIRLWRYAQADDRDVWDREADLNSLTAAERLWRRDPASALPQLAELAEGGSVWSMTLLGWTYNSGTGVAADEVAAERWYRRAVQGGCQRALLSLCSILARRHDWPAVVEICSIRTAEFWAPAMYYLALAKLHRPTTPARREDARVLLERAAAQGDLGSEHGLAVACVRGWFGWHRIPGGVLRLVAVARKLIALAPQRAPAAAPPARAVATATVPAVSAIATR